MEIRIATKEEIPGILELLRPVGQVHHAIRPDIFPSNTLKYDAGALEEMLDIPKRPIFVAMEEGLVAGYCFCLLREYAHSRISVQRKELYIDDLCVDEQHRGQGIATALYRHVSRYAKEIGCQTISLNVWCGNDNAMAFYKKIGMQQRSITMETLL